VAQLTDRPVLVVGQPFEDDRRPAGAVGLVDDFLVVDARLLARAAADGPLDVLRGM